MSFDAPPMMMYTITRMVHRMYWGWGVSGLNAWGRCVITITAIHHKAMNDKLYETVLDQRSSHMFHMQSQ